MKALVFNGKKINLSSNFKNPELPCGEALIKVNMAGICNTDIEITQRLYEI